MEDVSPHVRFDHSIDSSLAPISLLDPAKDREHKTRERKSELMADIRSLRTDQGCKRASIPSHLHSKSSSQKTERKCSYGCPTEWQQGWSIPSIEVICFPSAPENEMLLQHDGYMNYCPVSNNAEQSLQSVFKVIRLEQRCTAGLSRIRNGKKHIHHHRLEDCSRWHCSP